MVKPSDASPKPEVIQAAGGLLWRRTSQGIEIALVHRIKYDDWALPKGKLNPGESWQKAALREVREETGYSALLLGFAGAVQYIVDGAPKVVRFWHMSAQGSPAAFWENEIKEVAWLPVSLALKRLDYPLERALVENSTPPDDFDTPLTSKPRRSWWMRMWVFLQRILGLESSSLLRLEQTLPVLRAELLAQIECCRQAGDLPFKCNWDQHALHLLAQAAHAANQRNADLGWRLLKAANRFRFYGMDETAIKHQAAAVLREIIDDRKGVNKWRKETIQAMLQNNQGEMNQPLNVEAVIEARRILDEHYDNDYAKLAILRDRLNLFNTVSLALIVGWLAVAPLLPLLAPRVGGPRLLWLCVILAGILGAVISGFTASFSGDSRRSRIPSEIAMTTITIARFFTAAVSSIAITIFLVSGILSFVSPDFPLVLAVAIVAGFSDRLLLGAIDRVANPG